MATRYRADTKAQIAVIPNTKCELCEENDISWKCFNCEEYLCHQCKKTHLKSKLGRDHRVTTVKGADKQEQQVHEEKQDPKCNLHPSENISDMYCQKCDIPLCTDCIVSGSHKNHTILKIKDIIDKKQIELSSVISESNKKLSEFEQNMKSIMRINTDFSKGIVKCIEEVKSKNVKLKTTLDQITKEIITKLKEIEKQNQDISRKKENETEKNISELKDIIQICKDKQTKRETELNQFVRDVKQKLDKFKPSDPLVHINQPIFVTRDVAVEDVKALFGYLDLEEDKRSDYERSKTVSSINTNPTIDVKVISTFTMSNTNTVAAVSDNQAWVYQFTLLDYNNVKLVTSDGNVIQTINIDFTVYDMAVTKSGELVVTANRDNKVKKLTSVVRFVDVYVDPAGYETRGITVTDNNYIIVCLYNRGTKEGKLVQLTPAGQQITTIQYDRDGKTPLFNDPRALSSSRNGDLIVVNQSGKEVVVVDETGHKRFTYTGQVKGLKKSFSPTYIVTDQYRHIIISDNANSALHLLDKDGNFLQFLLLNKHGINNPKGMSIDKSGRLWVCDMDMAVLVDFSYQSKIMVVKYV